MEKYISPSNSDYWGINPNKKELPTGATVGVNPDKSVNYNPDGTRTINEVDSYYNSLKPSSAEDWQAQRETIKNNISSKMQTEIDSINSVYKEIYAREAENAQGRLGSTAMINALSQQRGAPTGAANTEKTNSFNTSKVEAIDAKKGMEINLIRKGYADDEKNELRYQETLRREDSDKWAEYMKSEEKRTEERKGKKLDDMINAGIGMDSWDENEVEDYMSIYGYENPDDARKAIDFKVGEVLAAKEKERVEEKRKTEEYEQKKIDAENELRAKGYEYIPNEDALKLIDKKQYDIVRLKQPDGQPDKLYKVPKGMSELDVYEAKKQIDAKYKTGSDPKDTLSLNKDEQAFYKDVDSALGDLTGGKKTWGEAFTLIKSKYGAPDDVIDNLLNKEKWSKPGAYEEELKGRKNIEADAFSQWLNSAK